MHMLDSISKRKDNQAIKFSQLIESTMRNNFLKKSSRKWGIETSSRSLLYFWKISEVQQVTTTYKF